MSLMGYHRKVIAEQKVCCYRLQTFHQVLQGMLLIQTVWQADDDQPAGKYFLDILRKIPSFVLFSGKSFHARKQKEEIQNSAFVLETGSPDPRKSIPMPHGSLLHQDTGDLSAPKHGHDRQPGSSVGSTSKEVGKDLPSSGGHTFQSMTNISDGGIFVRSAIKLDNESTVSLHSRRREMPASLLEGKTGLMLPNSSTNNLQTEKARQLRMDQEIPMPHDSLLHQESGDLSVPKHGHDGQPDSLVGLTSKEVGKGLSSPGGHTSQSMIGVSDGGTSLGSAIKLDNESTVSLLSRRRKMPASLLEGKTGLALPNSSIDNLQLEKAKQLRMTRSSSTESPGAMEMSFENSDRLAAQCPILEPHTKDFHADHAEETHQNTEKKDEGEDFPSSEQEQAHLSPPLLAGLNGNITIRKKPSVASLPVETDRTIDTSFQKQGLSTPDIVKAQTELRDGQANLSAAVHDPLPEAVQIAEQVAKFCNTAEQEQALVANNGIEVMENLPKKLDSSDLLEKGVQGSHETCRKRSIMERNPTAHTVEWETSDDIADSSDDISPSRSRHVKLPKFQTRQSSCNASRKPLHVEPKRRKFKRWTVEEENILRKEVERYGKGVWKHILSKHRDVFEGRTEVDLKDKWRNIERREGIL
ncbi:hypothetical protein KP509_27G042100 [Ceratopteris richardii]|uniref:Uncharacterized protein n=1 Tax=Ceratopteris richardii TaxID=49495 RepID=A0A8T2RIA3_CERRI|nr:hypothetical protein KP509_27G042100 [Ceratopteris richardii]